MGSGSKSREHHWWPVGLQKFWADQHGDVAWISADGKVDKKRVKNRKVARKPHGHTALKGSVWETNFEDDFQRADNSVPRIINRLESLRERYKSDTLQEEEHRLLLLLIVSLLIRSPANRFRWESYPEQFGLPADENVGKLNMRQMFCTAKKLCETGRLSNQCFVLIHSPLKKFIFGDGHLDWLTYKPVGLSMNGRALVPLTPHLCVYFCTRLVMRTGPNCVFFGAAPWMVDWINDITQIYSRDKLFYLGCPPKLSQAFRQRQFLEHKEKTDELIDMLDEIAGNKRSERAPVYSTSSLLD